MLAELILPGLIVIFLGLGAWLVALGIYLGVWTDWASILTAWMVMSIALILGLRSMFARLAPGNRVKGVLDEDLEASDTLVEVVAVDPTDPTRGRVSFRGSTWQVECLGGGLQPGKKVRLLKRENLVWLVEPLKELPAP